MKKLRFNNMKQFSQDSSFVDPGFKFRSSPPKLHSKETLCSGSYSLEWKTKPRDFLSFSPGSQSTYPLRGDGRQARQQQKSKEIDNAGPGKSQTDLKQFTKTGRLGANQSSRAIFLELTGSSTGWWGTPPHSLQSHGQRLDGACRSASDASYSLGKWLKQAQ